MLSVINLIIRIFKTGYTQNLAGQGPEQCALRWTCFEQGVRMRWCPEISFSLYCSFDSVTYKKIKPTFVILIYCLIIYGIFWRVCVMGMVQMLSRSKTTYFKDSFKGNIYSKSRVAQKWGMSCDRLCSIEALSLVLLSKLSEQKMVNCIRIGIVLRTS